MVETSLFESKNTSVIQINDREPLNYTYDEPQYGMSDSIKGSVYGQFEQHPALLDPGYADLGVCTVKYMIYLCFLSILQALE